ncbi:AfsR/SARP family transcriptional regulator [Saccharothrix obliqua]|uniref:AfsR/SARP family transcriptional regulator n=1 Tax=Saccharothrix obliqua TaxID=2861747 RepID=UPI001C5F4146|nr:AfsR/SARP family transcriptional regulator [Saccharothrix obliqua]MBW4717528.1 AfsR/SARP family transcriptional regulator [Saccharothrix obliqua]
MKFNLFGPLSVRADGVDSTPSAPKQRQMLALLLLNANHVVSIAQFTEELWECGPPPSAVAVVHTYVMQLRRKLCDAGAHTGEATPRLVTREQGYLLRVLPGELDLGVYENQVRAARHALAQHRYAAAARRLRMALNGCPGPLMVDVAVGPLLRAGIEVVERDRLAAVGQRIEAELRLGRHHDLVGELSALACRHPADEALTAQLMLALYRSGRQADALAAFHRLRRTLGDELAAVPSPRMHQLYSDILAARPWLEAAADSRTRLSLDLVATAAVPVPD